MTTREQENRFIRRSTTLTASALLLCLAAACGGSKDPAKSADDVSGDAGAPEPGASAAAPSTDHTLPGPGANDDKAPSKKDDCSGFAIEDLDDVLQKSACEVPVPGAGEKTIDPKDKLDVKVTATSTKVPAGGHADLLVTFTNKGKEPLPLVFTIDPLPRFDVQAYNAKGKRADLPSAKEPALPAGVPARTATEVKAARVILVPNGSAKIHVGWDAVKTKWAPEKLKGTPPEMGYPRVPAGPLAKGKYTVRVATRLLGFFEGIDHEVSEPRLEIEVTK